ncbi:SDR family NAD(P)-dependent oxidoreductase [Aliifodinibius salicampi]|uniref:SDR family NAD(P)-dependent oxidoreductase n=1 Tax=Fodinibius salicampi TaxID=1920655 RepID=A0ABT3Q2V8_9BACT|nr:SDR family NAD(P)-dependent oxidoreductase [Fodinibius salicampi]MCW9714431.1 SDR family NAD(P)-dependent oxidoreductase [Fodinibius salicampi]
MSSFKDKNVLITGGAGGIGLLMAIQILKDEPNAIIIWDNNPENIESAEHKLWGSSAEVATNIVDIADPDQIYEAAERLLNQLNNIDIIINNAGIIIGGLFSERSTEEIQQTININLLGAMHVSRAFLPSMQKQGSGHIVNIASAAGLMGNPRMTVYAASKWGLIGWSESLRIELEQQKSGIKVTTVEPSYIDTGMFAGVTPPFLTPLLDPEDFSESVIEAIKKNKIHLRAPFMVKLLPFLRGILPARIFDYVAGKLFGVYHSMDTFKGRDQS